MDPESGGGGLRVSNKSEEQLAAPMEAFRSLAGGWVWRYTQPKERTVMDRAGGQQIVSAWPGN